MNKAKTLPIWHNPALFDLVMEIMILALVFLMPTIFDRRLGIVFSGTKVAWMRSFGLVMLGLWSIKLIVLKQHRFIRTPLDWPILSYLLCTTIATLTSVHVYTSWAGFYGRYEGLTSWFLFGVFFFVVTNYMKTRAQLERIIVTVMSASTLMAVYSVIQRHAWDPYMWGGVVTWQRVIGMIGQPNFLAAYILMAFFLTLALFLLDEPKAPAAINWPAQLAALGCFLFTQLGFLLMIYNLDAQDVLLWYLGFVLITLSTVLFAFNYRKLHPVLLDILICFCLLLAYVCILYTQSRGGYMGFFTGAVLFALVAGRKWLFHNWRKLVILSSLIMLVSLVTMANPEFSPFKRFTDEISTEKMAAEGARQTKLELGGAAGSRGETWKSAFAIIADYPVFGIGPEVLKMVFPRYETDLFRFKETFHVKQDRCHNETFDVSVTKGLITFFVYVWLIAVLFRVGWQKSQRENHHDKLILAGLLAALLSYLIQNQFSFGVVAITSLFWIIWALVMVIGENLPAEQPRLAALNWNEVPWLPISAVILLVALGSYVSFASFRGDVWFKLGKTQMEMGQLEPAAGALEKSLAVFPLEGGTVSHLGITYLNLARSQQAALPKAIDAINYGTRIDPYNADNFFLLAKVYLMVNDLNQARKNAEIALKIDPYYAEVYLTLGLLDEQQGKYPSAAQNFERSFFINPNLVEPMQQLVDLNKRQGQTQNTLQVFERALAKYNANPVVLARVARLYLERGALAKALATAEKLIKVDPRSPAGYLLRGDLYLRQNKIEPAFLDFQQVLLSDPNNVDAHLGLSQAYRKMGNRPRAKEELEQVLKLEPNNQPAQAALNAF